MYGKVLRCVSEATEERRKKNIKVARAKGRRMPGRGPNLRRNAKQSLEKLRSGR